MFEREPSYFCIIPSYIMEDRELTDGAKLLYGEIIALAIKEGFCYATNKYLGDILGKDERTIRRHVAELVGKKLIQSSVKKDFSGTHRKLKLNNLKTSGGRTKTAHPPQDKNDIRGWDKNALPKDNITKDIKIKNKDVYISDDIYTPIASELAEKIASNNPKSPVANGGRGTCVRAWSRVIEDMVVKDKRDIKDIKQVIAFSQRDKFWKRVILTGALLRKNFDNLYARCSKRDYSELSEEFEKAERRMRENEQTTGRI